MFKKVDELTENINKNSLTALHIFLKGAIIFYEEGGRLFVRGPTFFGVPGEPIYGEPIYFYVIGKNAEPNQMLTSTNDHLWISPRKPGWYHNDPGNLCSPQRSRFGNSATKGSVLRTKMVPLSVIYS